MGLSYLLDTNVLLSVSKRGRIDTPPFEGVLEHLVLSGTPLYYTLQNAAEYWNVFTRPLDRNGFGLPADAAARELADLEAMLVLLAETTDVYTHWRRLVTDYGIAGVKVHDARLV